MKSPRFAVIRMLRYFFDLEERNVDNKQILWGAETVVAELKGGCA